MGALSVSTTKSEQVRPEIIRQARPRLNSRLVGELAADANHLRLLMTAGRPNFAELKETGISPNSRGVCIFSLPTTYDMGDSSWFFQKQVIGSLERGFGRTRWDFITAHRPEFWTPHSAGAEHGHTGGECYVHLTPPHDSPRRGYLTGLQFALLIPQNRGTPCAKGDDQTLLNHDKMRAPLKIYLLKHGGGD